MEIRKEKFGAILQREVKLYTLKNDQGIEVKLTDFGGIVTHMMLPCRDGSVKDIVLGFANLEQYLQPHPYFGALIGRFGNRIKKGRFRIDDIEYKLAINNLDNHLHGGLVGFDKVIWSASESSSSDHVSIDLFYKSVDMEEGYPGNLECTVRYTLNNKNEFIIEYMATTDIKTHLNLTHHGYYNLNGCSSNIMDHIIEIHADEYVEVDEQSIPTGKILPLKNDPLDLTKPTQLSDSLPQLPNGYDNTYIIKRKQVGECVPAASVICEKTGIIMDVLTTEPGIQFYTSNYLDGSIVGKNNRTYQKHDGFCLEAQHYPDSPNHPHFPSTILEPGNTYTQKTLHRFSVK